MNCCWKSSRPRITPRPTRTCCIALLKRLYNLGIYPAWWKIEAQSAEEWQQLDALIQERDPYRGVVLLGLNAPASALAEGFQQASKSQTCRGFAVGRTIFQEPSRAWLAGKSTMKC